jgi:aspartate aminotransferase
MAFFSNVLLASPDPIFHLNTCYKQDQDSRKVNVGVGAYRTNEEKPWVLPVVKRAERMLVEEDLDHEYLPIVGLEPFVNASIRLILGSDSPAIIHNRAIGVQSISGTGALRIGAEFLAKYKPGIHVYISNPTWTPHMTIFSQAGLSVHEYPYYDPAHPGAVQILELMDIIKNKAPSGSCFVLHACAHNPTGMDPTPDQWEEIAFAVKERNHFVFFDCAYQGFATGDIDRDAYAVRLFVSMGLEMFIAQSYSKNFGLYNERVGCLVSINSDSNTSLNVKSQLAKVIRPMISNPPAHGARIVSMILNSESMTTEWLSNLKTMVDRIQAMRRTLYDLLTTTYKTPGNWGHLTAQQGMFGYTGLSEAQAKRLRSEYHIYLTDNGRISIAGLTTNNVSYVASCIDEVVRQSLQ